MATATGEQKQTAESSTWNIREHDSKRGDKIIAAKGLAPRAVDRATAETAGATSTAAIAGATSTKASSERNPTAATTTVFSVQQTGQNNQQQQEQQQPQEEGDEDIPQSLAHLVAAACLLEQEPANLNMALQLATILAMHPSLRQLLRPLLQVHLQQQLTHLGVLVKETTDSKERHLQQQTAAQITVLLSTLQRKGSIAPTTAGTTAAAAKAAAKAAAAAAAAPSADVA
ncbi:uncharacterized protein LOC34622064, partial [Cyclospora cayetanensis]|uniref:Uncharacterized protein LOC34622064 n=1 Tax=Cyclospora cayetanensis TaxID=88456 RepID=A0A6P6RRX2_9EIME